MWRLVPLVAPIVLASVTLSACSSTSNSASVLLVGTLNGKAGAYHSIEAAVDAAKSGDWILVAPGDYHERADHLHPPTDPQHGAMGGVYITTPNLHL